MTRFNLTTLCLGSFVLFALPGCGRKPDEGMTDGDTSTGDASTTEDELPTEGGKTQTSAEDPTTTTGGVSDSESADTTDPSSPATSVTTGEPACADLEGQDNDAECTDPSGCGCASGKCFLVPILGGWCGECLADADCSPGGCTVPNPIGGIGSTCNMGEPGQGCMSDEVCTDAANAACGTLLEVPGIISVATCGECATNEECLTPELPNCTPTYDVENFTGKYVCVADATVANNEGCNLADDGMGQPVGNTACMSGFCGEANVMGLLKVGICGECNSNADCGGGTCTDPIVDLETAALVGSVCQ